MIRDMADYGLALAEGVMAVLLWHRAEPRMRLARGWRQSWCIIFLGFVLAWSVPLAFMRPTLDNPADWQRSMRDVALLLTAMCLYFHAMHVKARDNPQPDKPGDT